MSEDNKNIADENVISAVKEETINAEPDPYAYRNNGFTSEIFKIEVRGLPKHYGIAEFRKLLKVKLKLDCNKVKSPGNRSSWLYACFRSEDERDKAIESISGHKWKGVILSAKVADPAPDPLVKRRIEDSSDGNKNKRIKLTTAEDQHEALLNSTSPLWKIPYLEQVKQKTEDAKSVLRRLGSELVKSNPGLKHWIEEKKKLHDGLLCELLETKCLSDNYNNYRNKCEFTIGKDEITGERRVGFRLGRYASGSLGVGPVNDLPIIPEIIAHSAKAFEKFVQNSDYEVFSPEDLSGHWKQLTVRLGVGTGEVMLIVGFHPQNLSTEELSLVKDKIRDYYKYKNEEFPDCKVDSLYFQLMKRKERGADSDDYEFILGKEYIEEIMCGLKFKISPRSFFQINTKCGELLIDCARDLSKLDSDSVLLDVCCGTGTIGLCLAKHCSRVLGIEIIEQAVEDAKENAKKNNIDNSEFFCGKADEIFTSVMSRISEDQQAVAVLDPPRAGLHHKAILMLRKANNLKRLVFMSCDSKNAFKNFIELGRAPSKTLLGQPFVPVSAVVVDMFPHTNHYELVLYFERLNVISEKDIPDSKSEEKSQNT